MSWRIYFEYIWWFGLHVPMYMGKWHLDVNFDEMFVKALRSNVDGLFPNIYKTFNKIIDQGGNIGLLDAMRGDQLFRNYYTTKHFDDFLENTKFEPRRCNVFVGLKYACFYTARWYAKLQWNGLGLRGLLARQNLYHFFRLLGLASHAAIGDLIYRFKTRGLPANSQIAAMREEAKNYEYIPKLQSWDHTVGDSQPALNGTQRLTSATRVTILSPDMSRD
jgi:hypothetical protein